MGEGAMPVYEVGRDGMFGGDSFMWIIFLFFLIGWGGNVFGGNGALGTYATQADIQRGFDTNSIISKLDGITNGLSDGFYAQNTTMLQGFNGVGSAIANLGYQLQTCCCETNRNIDAVRYEDAKNTCAIIQANNENTQRILDKMCANEINDLRDRLALANNSLASQTLARQIVAEVRPCPQPSYIVANPYCGYSNSCAGGTLI